MAKTPPPRRSLRLPHNHTPKMTERKKSLFQSESGGSRDSLTRHRQLTVLDSESESDDCDLGIMGTLDSSSCDENDSNAPKTPERTVWHGTRSQTRKLIRENQDLKNFIKSPFTLKKFQSKFTGSASTPATPHFQNNPATPSSSHSCPSVHTTSSSSSRARKSLASLIADTESCSSSLKDLNFDTDSGADSKENTPSNSVRRSTRRNKMTPKYESFKGILVEQKRNMSPISNSDVCLTKIDINSIISPTQMLKTPHNTSEANISPPKISHNRRSNILIDESPEPVCESEKSHKRLYYDSETDNGPISKWPRLETSAPKARLSLFNSDRLKEILSAKSFYGKSNPDLNSNITVKISKAIEATQSHRRRLFPQSHSQRRKRRPGQINLGVRHKIRKPKVHRSLNMPTKGSLSANSSGNASKFNSTASSGMNNASMVSHNTSQELETDKADPFDKEKRTIEDLLSQWTEEEIPESELNLNKSKPELPCFNRSVMEATNAIFQPVTAVPVAVKNMTRDTGAVILELGGEKENVPSPNTPQQDVVMLEAGHKATHGDIPRSGQFLPVEGGYILVENEFPEQEELPDLDEIERELRMLDEQILKMAHSNNIDPQAVLASTETAVLELPSKSAGADIENKQDKTHKLFSIFSKPNPGTPSTPSSKEKHEKINKKLLKTGSNQYVIDAGQNKFGATQCAECGVIYQIGDPQDEHDHLVHHNATDVLKFPPLKDEVVVGRVTREGGARCLRVRGGGPGWRRVEALLARVVHPHLGYGGRLPGDALHEYTAYLYVDKKQIMGCLIVQPKVKAYKLIPGDPDCCSEESYPVKCGVSRMWTHKNWRRRGLASRLLDCARASFLYGGGVEVEELAFSAPTAAGKALATKYCGTPNFYVYLD